MKTRFLALLAFFVLNGFHSLQAQNPIQGDIDFNGVVTFDTMSLATATQVNIWNTSFVSQRSGDFVAFVNVTDNATMTAPWVFNSGTPGAPAPGPATPALWSVGGFTFDLTSSMVFLQDSGFLNVTGVGTVFGHGFDPTPGLWSFTSSNDGSPQSTFSFQANTSVPESSTVGLLILGAVGLVATRGRWKRRVDEIPAR